MQSVWQMQVCRLVKFMTVPERWPISQQATSPAAQFVDPL
jgi:hypothetical protein